MNLIILHIWLILDINLKDQRNQNEVLIKNKDTELIHIDSQIELMRDKIIDANDEIQRVWDDINHIEEQIINWNNILKAKEEISKVSFDFNLL